MKKSLVSFLTILFSVSFLSAEELIEENYTLPIVSTTAVYAAISEKPDMVKVLLIGDEAKAQAQLFTRAGIKAETKIRGKYDAVFVSCDGMSEGSFKRMTALLKAGGIVAWMFKADRIKMSEFKETLGVFDMPSVQLWMPGENTWLLIGRKRASKVKLSAITEALSREDAMGDLAKARITSIGRLLASYVGSKEEIMPAFANLTSETDGPLKCEYFLTQDLNEPSFLYVDIEKDIYETMKASIVSAQEARREFILGIITGLSGKEDEALELMANAAKKNAGDPILFERLERIERNAVGYHNQDQILMELKCYETMLIIQPNNLRAVKKMGECYQMIGRQDIAEKCFERAKELSAE